MSESTNKKIDYIVNIVFVILIAGLVFFFFKYVVGLILPFIIAFIMVSVLHPLIRWMHKQFRINQKFLSVALMLLLYAFVGSLLFWLVLQVIFLLQSALSGLPSYYAQTIAPALTSLWTFLDDFAADLPPAWVSSFETVENSLINGAQNLFISISQTGISFITRFINALPSFFITLIFTVMLSFFIGQQYDEVIAFIRDHLPPKAQEFARGLRSILKNTIFRYLRAYLILMSITFVELAVGFTVVGTPSAIGVAAGIAIFDALPVFGTGGIMIPWVIIEGIQGNLSYAFQLLIVYGIVTTVRNVIEPKVVGDQLGLNPIVSLMAVYLGYRQFGVIGMILCPIATRILLALYQNGHFGSFGRNIDKSESDTAYDDADTPEPAAVADLPGPDTITEE